MKKRIADRGEEAESDEIQRIVRHHRKDFSSEFHDHPHRIDLNHVSPEDLGEEPKSSKKKGKLNEKVQKREAA